MNVTSPAGLRLRRSALVLALSHCGLSASADGAPADSGGHCAAGLSGHPGATEVRPFPTAASGAVLSRYARTVPPIWDNLGSLHYPITTADPKAQRYFDQGLRLAYAFNHVEARRAFKKAARIDPACALCYWGEALVLGPNINAAMEAGALDPARTAMSRAKNNAPGASGRERALIEALSLRYSEDPKAPRAGLDGAYAEAMGKVAARYPQDTDIQVLYAEALMDLSPWDYWEAGGTRPKGRTAEIIAILERVLAIHPDHAGAIHFYIHMVEASDRPERAAPYAARLGALMPGAGHLVHMPFHIYFRTGRYLEALEVNRAAVAADERYLGAVAPPGIYAMAYYPHNVHSLMVSAQMAGDGKSALAAARKLARVVSVEGVRTIPWVQPIQAAPYFAHAQFSAPDRVLALAAPPGELPFVQAMWHYARGVARAAKKDLVAAAREAEAIARIGTHSDFSELTAGGIPAPDILELARRVVAGRIARARGDLGAARAAFEEAVALQDQLAYSEPPHWYYPVRQSLGAVLLASGDLKGAEQAFHASLERAPNNGWALYGLAQVYARQGDREAQAAVQARFERAWIVGRGAPALERL